MYTHHPFCIVRNKCQAVLYRVEAGLTAIGKQVETLPCLPC